MLNRPAVNQPSLSGPSGPVALVRPSGRGRLRDVAEQLSLEDELALLVLLRVLKGLVVFPAHRLLTLAAGDVADNVAARRHVTLVGLAGVDVDDIVEEVGFAVLATEILRADERQRCGRGCEGRAESR